MQLNLSFGLQERGSGVSFSLTAGQSRRSRWLSSFSCSFKAESPWTTTDIRNPQPDDCPDMATTRVFVNWLVSNKPKPLVSVSVKFLREVQQSQLAGQANWLRWSLRGSQSWLAEQLTWLTRLAWPVKAKRSLKWLRLTLADTKPQIEQLDEDCLPRRVRRK